MSKVNFYKRALLMGLLGSHQLVEAKSLFSIHQPGFGFMSATVLNGLVIGLLLLLVLFMVLRMQDQNSIKGYKSKLWEVQQSNKLISKAQVSSTVGRFNVEGEEKLKREIAALQSQVVDLINDLANSGVGQLEQQNITNNEQIATAVEASPVVVTSEYVASCMTGGAFVDLKPVAQKDRKTPYIIYQQGNAYFFSLDAENQEALINSMQNRGSYIEGFCDTQNNYFSEARTFVQESGLGKLEQVGDTFKVIEKIKIKYI